MARLFSIDIPFKNEHYPALVSVRDQGYDLSCQVRYVDKRLQYILPGDILIINLTEGLKQPINLPGDLAKELVRCTSEAISDYLQKQRH